MRSSHLRYLSTALVLIGLTAQAPVASAQVVSEYEAKAAFLYNLLKFVQWPNLPKQTAPFLACVMEPDPFGNALTAVLHQKAVSGRPIELRQLKTSEGIRECQVVFIPVRDTRRVTGLLRAVQRAAVLTVGEAAEFLDAGGMVSIVLTDGKLRLQINIEAVHASDLKMSAQLLRLAQDAKGGR